MITIETLDDTTNHIIETIEDRFLSALFDVESEGMTKREVRDVLKHAIECGKTYKVATLDSINRRENA